MKATCPACSSRINVAEKYVDHRLYCPKCGAAFIPRTGFPVARALPIAVSTRSVRRSIVVVGAVVVMMAVAVLIVAIAVRFGQADANPSAVKESHETNGPQTTPLVRDDKAVAVAARWDNVEPYVAPPPLTAEELFAARSKSVVVVLAFDKKGKAEGQGSGFVVVSDLPKGPPSARVTPETADEREARKYSADSGIPLLTCGILTNYHVVENAASLDVYFDERRMPACARILAYDEYLDLAILEARYLDFERRPAIQLVDFTPTTGEPAYVIGSPEGLEFTITSGIVSAVRKGAKVKWIQTTCGIAPGSSGAPLLDRTGRLLGVVTARVGGEHFLGAALAHDEVRKFLAIFAETAK